MNRFLLFALLNALIFSIACNKEENFITDSNAKLEFSLDTLRFDTVFTELGSATRFFKVFNRKDQAIRISNIHIESGEGTAFRLNIDGLPGNESNEVRILANDSIYIFAEVTIDPNQPLTESPFVVEDKIIFETNGNVQEVHLEAWGQNANYFPNRDNKGVPVLLSCNFNEISWDDPKPYVIYGEIFIDSCTLNIPAGTQIYVHGGIARNDLFGIFNDGIIYVLENGKIVIEGSPDRPVVIQGDRLEESFQDEEGQWNGIILGKGSKGNIMEYTTVKNCIFGIYVDSTAELTARNCQFYNTAGSGLIGFHSKIKAENCLLYNNAANSVQLIQGGDYHFTYCTIASYGVDASALSMSNFFCYDGPFGCNQRKDYRLNATFKNTIIFGSRDDELILSDIAGGQSLDMFNVLFENCIVKVEKLLEQEDGLYVGFFEEQCNPCFNGSRDDVLFFDPNGDDYHLDTLSIAEGQAKPISFPRLIDIDLEGNSRDPQAPDVGCYEYKK